MFLFAMSWGYFFLNFVVFLLVVFGGYMAFLEMVKRDIIFTEVREGYHKIVMRRGKLWRILTPGWNIIGFPGMDRLYEKAMTFLECVTDDKGNYTAKPHNDEKVNEFKTIPFPYAVPFNDQEDSNGLPLTGIIMVDGVVEDYELAFFSGNSRWYSRMNAQVMTMWRDYVLPQISWEEIVGKNKNNQGAQRQIVSEVLWRTLNQSIQGGPSLLERLRTSIGFRIEDISLVAIDPPPGWRETTLAPYAAQKKKEAAVEEAKASAAAFDDTNQALALWKKEHPNAGPDEIKEKQKELRDRAMAKSPQYHQEDVRISGVEGAGTIVIGGGGQGAGAGILVGNQGGNSGGKGSSGKTSSAVGRKALTFVKGDMEPKRKDYKDQASFEADHDAWKQAQK